MRLMAIDVPTSPEVLVPHGASIGALVAAASGWLPAFVAIIPAVYYLILIWESSTVQHALRNFRMRRKARKVIRLKAKAAVVAAQLEAEELVRVARTDAKEKIKVAAHEAAKEAVAQTAAAEAKIPPV